MCRHLEAWCVSQQFQKHEGDTERRAITGGELDSVVEEQQPLNRTGICSFVQGGTGEALPEPSKWLLVCTGVLTSCQKQAS